MMNSQKRWILLIVGIMFAGKMWAFPCKYTVSKTCCWTNFNVTVSLIDTANKQVVTQLTVPAGKTSVDSAFDCQPGQTFELSATFSPVIWDEDKNKSFKSKKFLSLKSQIDPQDVAWHIPIEFPTQFANVPLPTNISNCKCAE